MLHCCRGGGHQRDPTPRHQPLLGSRLNLKDASDLKANARASNTRLPDIRPRAFAVAPATAVIARAGLQPLMGYASVEKHT